MIIVYLGDTGEYLAELAKNSDPSAKLVTGKNFKSLVNGTYYSSLGDIGNLRNFGFFLQQADRIIYAPPANDHWTGGQRMKKFTLDYLESFYYRCDIINFVPPQKDQSAMLDLSDVRKIKGKQLWIAGCSISHGFALTDKQKRYGDLIATDLRLPASFLTYPGSSICWAADQILRSDVRPDDILIWGLTSQHRLPFFLDGAVCHIHPRFLDTFPAYAKYVTPNNLQENNTTYRHLTSIFQVINFCKKNHVILVLAGLLPTGFDAQIGNLPNFCQLSNLWGRDTEELFLDLASDNKHPGPRTHRFYADEIQDHLKRL